MSDLSELTTRWVRGWVASRSLPSPEDLGDGLRVECHQAGRDVEVFARNADDDPASITRLAARVLREPSATWLTVPTTRAEQTAELLEQGGLCVLRRNEQMMTADLARHPRHPVPEPYHLVVEPGDAMVYVEIRKGDEAAARGVVGLAGHAAVMDRILTWPEHRRRGLANAVMGVLAAEAIARGAGFGILVASEDGQRLYPALGWSAVADVLISAPPGVTYPEG
jgi:ribosomal protein S18 acetylase RimI-like enzyme